MFLTYQYSISALPPDGFTSRPADVRVGNFYTIFEDYTNHDEEIDEATVRNIYRWRLEKEEPYAELSKPKQPIVYWLASSSAISAYTLRSSSTCEMK